MKPEHPEETHEGKEKTCKFSTESPQLGMRFKPKSSCISTTPHVGLTQVS